MKKTLTLLSIISLLSSCNSTTKKIENTSENKKQTKEIVDSISNKIKPIFGYRFIITGDFDGDGKKEKLIEHYFSSLDKKETNKFYDSLPKYEMLVELTTKKKPYSFVLSDNKSIDTLYISSNEQLLGLSYLKNEGDLNGDGTDEVSYVVNWADWSNLNTWHLMTYKNKKWQELYSFPIWDWQLPDLPETFNQYGLFGLENKIINTTNDTVNQRLENELASFKGLLKKIKTNKIQVIFRNDEAEEDTLIVNLKRAK